MGLGFMCLALAGASAYAARRGNTRRIRQVRALIRRAAYAVASTSSHITIGNAQAIDTMSPCPARPAVTLMGQGIYRDARVSCRALDWQLYVPVTIKQHARVVVAARDLMPGHVLQERDLKLVPAKYVSGDAALDAHAVRSALGRTIDAPLGAGQPIALASLEHPTLVHAGQTITVRVQSRSIVLKTIAVALQTGRLGQSILVKNPDSGRDYRVDVTARGAVDKLDW